MCSCSDPDAPVLHVEKLSAWTDLGVSEANCGQKAGRERLMSSVKESRAEGEEKTDLMFEGKGQGVQEGKEKRIRRDKC